ncbi:LpxI family protein [Zavarzinella formosa]|uniref:LpxI family protein n=1 Tax=Zavarzinella formosa TaxID=360055 RepID=UPI00030124E8|nr:UDP-2,3-diacylglucosamine diphosphatase LpxI [Zavarzinella formosa]
MEPTPIGLVAGWGTLPVRIVQKAHAAGIPVICLGIRGMADRAALEPYCKRFYWNRLAQMNRPIRLMKREGVKQWAMAGKVHKVQLFKRFRWVTLLPDLRMIRFWLRRRSNNSDDTITLAIIDEYAREGLECVSQLEICPELLVKPGCLTKRQPTDRETADMEYGWHLAKEMGRLDIGQSVAVRDRAVLAVEAIEGTDAAIRRAGELCRTGGFVVVKVAKPEQDMRFDVPTVGPSTIQTIKQAGGSALAIEAEKTILLDDEETIRLAEQFGICIVAR